MMGVILQSRTLEGAVALAAGAFALVVAWKSFEYVFTTLRNRREDRRSGENS